MIKSRIRQLPPGTHYSGEWVFEVFIQPCWMCAYAASPDYRAYSSCQWPRYASYDAARMACFEFFKASKTYIKP